MITGIKISDVAWVGYALALGLVFGAFYLTLSINQSDWRWQELTIAGLAILGFLVLLYTTIKDRRTENTEAKRRLVSYILHRFKDVDEATIEVRKTCTGIWEAAFEFTGRREVLLLRHGETYQPTKWTGTDDTG